MLECYPEDAYNILLSRISYNLPGGLLQTRLYVEEYICYILAVSVGLNSDLSQITIT